MAYPLPVVAINGATLVKGTPQNSSVLTSATVVKDHQVVVTITGINDSVNTAFQSQVALTPTSVNVNLLGSLDGTTFVSLGSKQFFGNQVGRFNVSSSPVLSVKLQASVATGASNSVVTVWIGSELWVSNPVLGAAPLCVTVRCAERLWGTVTPRTRARRRTKGLEHM